MVGLMVCICSFSYRRIKWESTNVASQTSPLCKRGDGLTNVASQTSPLCKRGDGLVVGRGTLLQLADKSTPSTLTHTLHTHLVPRVTVGTIRTDEQQLVSWIA